MLSGKSENFEFLRGSLLWSEVFELHRSGNSVVEERTTLLEPGRRFNEFQ